MKITPFKSAYPNLEKITTPAFFFERVKYDFTQQKKAGFFKTNLKPAFFVYQITRSLRTFTGLLAGADVEDYLNNHIKKHERTVVGGESKQNNLLAERGAAVKPILLTYTPVLEIAEFLTEYARASEPLFSLKLSEEEHVFWAITDPPKVLLIQKLFQEKVPNAYIADGHHRAHTYAHAYLNLKKNVLNHPSEKMFCAFFPSDELIINAFHRVVTCEKSLDNVEFWNKLLEIATIQFIGKSKMPTRKHDLTMFTAGRWVYLRWRKQTLMQFKKEYPNKVLLDVHILNEKVLKPLLGIKNVRTDKRLTYVDGTQSNVDLEKECPPYGAVFCMYPVDFKDLKRVSDTDGIMPPKSTFFEPRMKNGLIVYDFI
ncbi:MAG: hypothetical protein RLZZ628_2371 [Bacteroidota bacterium]|jgi:uncharacterized protein (DUF1015 family)